MDIDLMSKQPGKQKNKLLSSLLGVVLEKRWKMFEGRAANTGCPDLTAFYWRSEGDKLDMCECFGFVVMYAAAAGCSILL